MGWHAVQSALEVYGTPLVDDPARREGVRMVGVDETAMLKATPKAPTRFVSTVVDSERPAVLDLFDGRHGAQLDAWLTDQVQARKRSRSSSRCAICTSRSARRCARISENRRMARSFSPNRSGLTVLADKLHAWRSGYLEHSRS